jgi:hypothetical protein
MYRGTFMDVLTCSFKYAGQVGGACSAQRHENANEDDTTLANYPFLLCHDYDATPSLAR